MSSSEDMGRYFAAPYPAPRMRVTSDGYRVNRLDVLVLQGFHPSYTGSSSFRRVWVIPELNPK
jgi:hypothetical protein